MKYKGITPEIKSFGDISPSGKCQANRTYKDKQCYLYTSVLSTSYNGIKCDPMCFYCFKNFKDDVNF